MPTLKINAKAKAHSTGFEAYAGPSPDRPGAYRALVKKLRWREFNTGSQGFVALVELQSAADTPDKKKFDGAPYWTNIVAVTPDGSPMKDGSIRKLEAFLDALGTDAETVTWEDGDVKRGADLTRLGKKPVRSLVDTVVIVDLSVDTSGQGGALEVRNLRSAGSDTTGARANDDGWSVSEDDIATAEAAAPNAEPAADTSADTDGREEELSGMRVPALRTLAQGLGVATNGLAKADLVSAILDAEGDSEDEDEEDEDDAPMALDSEPDEDEEEDEEEIEVEEDAEDEYKARADELAALDRNALKAALKTADPKRKVFKSTTDETLREWILSTEFTVEESDEDEPATGDAPF